MNPLEKLTYEAVISGYWSGRLHNGCLRIPTVYSLAHKCTAIILVALLAVLGCCEHLLHDVAHNAAGHADCEKHSCCAQHAERAARSNPPVKKHDPESCAVCRCLALPQLVDTPQQVFFAALLVSNIGCTAHPIVLCPVVPLVPIQGPPVNELTVSC